MVTYAVLWSGASAMSWGFTPTSRFAISVQVFESKNRRCRPILSIRTTPVLPVGLFGSAFFAGNRVAKIMSAASVNIGFDRRVNMPFIISPQPPSVSARSPSTMNNSPEAAQEAPNEGRQDRDTDGRRGCPRPQLRNQNGRISLLRGWPSGHRNPAWLGGTHAR